MFVYTISQLEFTAGNVRASLRNVTTMTADPVSDPPGSGVAGQDFLAGGFELDFRRMQFSLLGSGQATPPATVSSTPTAQ